VIYRSRNIAGHAHNNLIHHRFETEVKKDKEIRNYRTFLMKAKNLLDTGVNKEVVKKFLDSKSKS
jgi:hypothetical protein